MVTVKRKSSIKLMLLVIFIIGAILLVRFTPIKSYLTPEAMGSFLDRAGFWAPLIFIFIYAAGGAPWAASLPPP